MALGDRDVHCLDKRVLNNRCIVAKSRQTHSEGPEPDPIRDNLLSLLRVHGLGQMQHYPKGSVLYWQGDPVDVLYVVASGAVKESFLSEDGRVGTYGVWGAGRLLGANAYFLGTPHPAVAETLQDSQLVVISPDAFERALSENPKLSAVIMRELAREAHALSDQMRDLSFLDVQQRLRNSLVRLARDHGIPTDDGIVINLRITHEEMGALVSANRTTITACLSELKKRGYLWTEGQRLVIIPPEHMNILDQLSAAVVQGDDEGTRFWARQAALQNVDPFKALDALISGMKQIDRGYVRGEIELPDVVLAAFAMKGALPSLEARLQQSPQTVRPLGVVVIGTVFGDIHDIGKTIVAALLRARGFRVIDLGVNIEADEFVRAVRHYEPDILALSALTSTTALEIGQVVQALKEMDLRDQVRVMIGGGAVTPAQAKELGADGYHETARGAVELAWRLCTWH